MSLLAAALISSIIGGVASAAGAGMNASAQRKANEQAIASQNLSNNQSNISQAINNFNQSSNNTDFIDNYLTKFTNGSGTNKTNVSQFRNGGTKYYDRMKILKQKNYIG